MGIMGIHEQIPMLDLRFISEGAKKPYYVFVLSYLPIHVVSFFSRSDYSSIKALCVLQLLLRASHSQKTFQKLLHANSQKRDPTCFATKTDWHLKRMRAESFFSFFLSFFFCGKGLCVGVLKEITREGGEQRLKVHERCLTVHWQIIKVVFEIFKKIVYFLWLCVWEMFVGASNL